MFTGLQKYIKKLCNDGLCREITTSASTDGEIARIADLTVKSGGPALYFTNVANSRYPLFVNCFGSNQLAATAFGLSDINGFTTIGEKIFSSSVICRSPLKAAVSSSKYLPLFPAISDEPSGLVVEKPDMTALPALRVYPGDGGKFITMAVTVLADPDTGKMNYGLYRLQIFPDGKLGLHFHPNKDAAFIFEKWKKLGKRMPVSIAIGCDPRLVYAASAPLPHFISEMGFAGLLCGAPVSLRRCRINNLLVPQQCEFVFEGYCDTMELRDEGPFGDHTGYYSQKSPYPIFTPMLTVRRKNPVFTATVTGKPIMEDYFLGLITERLFLPALKLLCPEICDIHFFPEGVFHGAVALSIYNRFKGAAQKVMHFVWGNGQLMNSKFIIVVDAGVDVTNRSEVLWRLFNNVDFFSDITVVKGSLDELDTSSENRNTVGKIGGKIGIDATEKRSQQKADFDESVKKAVAKRWKEYGIL